MRHTEQFKQWVDKYRSSLASDYSVTALKTMIVLWALFVVIVVVFFVQNKYLLAGILLYEILP